MQRAMIDNIVITKQGCFSWFSMSPGPVWNGQYILVRAWTGDISSFSTDPIRPIWKRKKNLVFPVRKECRVSPELLSFATPYLPVGFLLILLHPASSSCFFFLPHSFLLFPPPSSTTHPLLLPLWDTNTCPLFLAWLRFSRAPLSSKQGSDERLVRYLMYGMSVH